jgi:telomerase reverse transcriptase
MQFRYQSRPQHLLCQGFEKDSRVEELDLEVDMVGVKTVFENGHVKALTGHNWTRLLRILGEDGALSIIRLLDKWSIFAITDQSCHQLSGKLTICQSQGQANSQGIPLSSRAMDKAQSNRADGLGRNQKHSIASRKPHDIRFVRSRVLYGRPTLNAGGTPRLGLCHIREYQIISEHFSHQLDILKRLADPECKEETIEFAKYVFPLQFRLHNVFTSILPKSEAQIFRDYTLRENDMADSRSSKVPKRLRGSVLDMLHHFRWAHSRLSYVELLNHHCPRQHHTLNEVNAPTELATSPMQVFRFCQSILKQLLGASRFGPDNWRVLSHHLQRFILLRRFENMSLGEVLEGVKVSCL